MAYQPPPPQPQSYGYNPQGAQYPQVTYANWGYRVASYLIDSLIASVPVLIAYVIIIGATAASSSGPNPAAPSGFVLVVVIVLYLASIGVAIWNVCIRQGRTGQTLGKQAVGTRLISMQTGRPIGGLMAFLRAVCHIVDGLPCYLGFLWPIWDTQRQTFADKIVNTVVVKT